MLGGPPGTPTVINISGLISTQEVIDAIGAHVDMNGGLPPHWQQGAN